MTKLLLFYRNNEKFENTALITFSVRISVSREGAAAVIFDEGIALAISEEKSTADAPSQTTEN